MKICIFGNKLSTSKLIEHFFINKIKISHLVLLNKSSASKIQISGVDTNLIKNAISKNIKVYNAKTYSLSEENDLNFFLKEKFDLGLCTGWQRLIPDNILKMFKFGVFGWHGSGFEFPNGRGRSPLNWSIRLGLKKIYHNCFKYNSGIDTGDIFETKKIEIKNTDYIADLQIKTNYHILDSSTRLIQDLLNSKLKLYPQTNYPFISFPSLDENSGQIFYDKISCQLAIQIIRSCSKPFPGAFLIYKSKKYRIWEAVNINIDKNQFNKHENVYIKSDNLYVKFVDGFIKSNNFEVQ
tara:strand:+ start:908 stop:1792 length:885 start_codon:yes stop_codon:yes gene_type:complete